MQSSGQYYAGAQSPIATDLHCARKCGGTQMASKPHSNLKSSVLTAPAQTFRPDNLNCATITGFLPAFRYGMVSRVANFTFRRQ